MELHCFVIMAHSLLSALRRGVWVDVIENLF
jgi:hypothetical protein